MLQTEDKSGSIDQEVEDLELDAMDNEDETTSFVQIKKHKQPAAVPTPPPPPPPKIPTGDELKPPKCVSGKANCGVLHDNMSVMWGEMKDAVDSLK